MPTVGEQIALKPFGLCPATDGLHVFDSKLIHAADAIRATYRFMPYDHRPELPERDKDYPYLMSEQFRLGYACFKYAVANIIQPRTITEIGVGAGTGARAFMAACPTAHYTGIDNKSKDVSGGWGFIDYTLDSLRKHGYHVDFIEADSMQLTSAPSADLFHVDGDHPYEVAYNDTRLALLSGSEWILIDDTRDFAVAAGALTAIHNVRVDTGLEYDWTHFEDTWTGSILVRRRG